MDRFIVAEISKNWYRGQSRTTPLIGQQFETVVNVNATRGYRLLTFSLARTLTDDGDGLNETIVAVFERAVQ